MTHLPYIAATYVIAIGIPIALSVGALISVRSARRRLAAIDIRRTRGQA